jgi:hypothetical protein
MNRTLRPSYLRNLYSEAIDLKQRLKQVELEIEAERHGLTVVCCGSCARFTGCTTRLLPVSICDDYVQMAPITRENCTGRNGLHCPHSDISYRRPNDCPCFNWTDAPTKEADDHAHQDDQPAAPQE